MKHHTDEVLIRFATRIMWASLALALGIGLGFAWRSSRFAGEGPGPIGHETFDSGGKIEAASKM